MRFYRGGREGDKIYGDSGFFVFLGFKNKFF